MKRKIYFRADADNHIGYGHFVRTLALADMLKDDFDCTFFTHTPTLYQQEEILKVCKIQELPSTDAKFDLFLKYLHGDEIVVLDNYFFTTDYQRAIKEKGCILVCVDDMHNKHYVANAVINHSLGIEPSDFSCESYTRLYLGLEYALLRKPFIDAIHQTYSKSISNNNLNIMISFGGADKSGIAEKIANKLLPIDKVEKITVISLDKKLNGKNSKVCYLSNQTAEEMRTHFQTSDLVIIPSSSIMKEAIACKANVFGGYFVENQKNSYIQFLQQNAIVGFGDLTDDANINQLIDFIESTNLSRIRLNHQLYSSDIVKNYKNLFNQYATI